MRLASEEYQALVHIALRGGKTRLSSHYGKYNMLVEKGLTEIANKGKLYNTYKLTSEGMEFILNMPNDLHVDFFPLPRDIAKAKEVVRNLKK